MTRAEQRQDIAADGIRFSIYRDAPLWDGLRTASIGKLKCAVPETGVLQLQETAQRLKTEGFEAVIAPMDGSTWHSYRAVVDSDGSPPFLMEPVSGQHDLRVLADAGFSPIAHYVSARVTTADAVGPRPVAHKTIHLENWNGSSADSFFGEIYDFSVEGFSRNLFYKPIDREAFLDLYRAYVAFLKRELIFFARRSDGSLAGFLFGIPDYSQGPETKTVILKTYASTEHGVGHLLADAFHRAALDHGYDTTIHALIQENNISLKRSALHSATVFRRHALLGLRL